MDELRRKVEEIQSNPKELEAFWRQAAERVVAVSRGRQHLGLAKDVD